MIAAPVEIRGRHWGLALAGAVLLHAALALMAASPKETGALSEGIGGIRISLGPAGGTPGEAGGVEVEESAVDEAGPPEAAHAEPLEAFAVVAAAAASQPVAASADSSTALPVESVTPVPVPEVRTTDIPLFNMPLESVPPAAEAVDATVTEIAEATVEATLAEPMDVPRAEVLETRDAGAAGAAVPLRRAMAAPPPPPAKPTLSKKTPKRASLPDPSLPGPPAAAPIESGHQAAAAAGDSGGSAEGTLENDQKGSGGEAGTGSSRSSGSADARSAGGKPAANIDYKAQLLAWLEQHKRYPRRARLRGYQGSAWLLFAVDRDGRLIDYRIEEGTGYKILDQEVEAMIERASPVPPPPAEGEKQRYVFRVPVGFYLR